MPHNSRDHVDDTVDALLTSARRDVDVAALREASVALGRDIATGTSLPRPRRRRAIAISVAALVSMVPTAAAAYAWTTHTGVFGQPDRYSEDVDASEVLDVCAPDFPVTARSLVPQDLLLPEGATVEAAYDEVLHSVTRDCRGADGFGALMQSTGVTARAEGYAWCSWVNDYLARPKARDDSAEALRHYANSDITHLVDADGGMTQWENQIADAAVRGDVDRVRYEQRINCGGGRYGWRP